jgi:hypothetical protein
MIADKQALLRSLRVLDHAASLAPVSRQDHNIILESTKTLNDFIEQSAAPQQPEPGREEPK